MVDLQILSDLHLEMIKELHENDYIPPRAPYLALLGDIGYGNSERLFHYLEAQLRNFRIIFFVLGNHEAYHSSWPAVKDNFQRFSQHIALKTPHDPALGRFVLLDKTRYDLSADVTILGCTLYTHVPAHHKAYVGQRFNDFHLIEGWTVDAHNAAHHQDLVWLNNQVSEISRMEPHRKIVILTHHSPSVDRRTVDPRFHDAGDNHPGGSGVRTDLRGRTCWENERVRLWAFGHTHFNCDFTEWTGRRVLTNQMGYIHSTSKGFDPLKVVTI
jgi:hypothetical protein